MRVERGNPVRVRLARLERGRQADREESWSPGREQDAQEANAGGRKVTGKRDSIVVSSDGGLV
jgi:hypothetical protein